MINSRSLLLLKYFRPDMNKRKQRMSSTVDKYMENKIIQYLQKDIKNKQVTSDSWGPGSHWLSVPYITITCPQQRNNRHASDGILILMSLLQHINKRWAKNSTSDLSKEVHAPLYPSHPKKKKVRTTNLPHIRYRNYFLKR